MTTEIAVLNRLGVALAADSAVTISGGGTTKVFDSADKLFELSCMYPIAVMLNGNMDCFGVPWEIIIKDFRAEHGSKSQDSVLDWASAFIDFIVKRPDIGDNAAQRYIEQVASDELLILRTNVSNKLFDDRKVFDPSLDKIVPPIIKQCIENRREYIATLQKAKSLVDIIDVIEKKYTDLINRIIDKALKPSPMPDDIKTEIRKLIFDAIFAMTPGPLSTGLIFAGYGKNDNYPSVYSIDIDGYVNNTLKYSEIVEMATISTPAHGYVISFAQTDVIERLLNGADPRFIEKTSDFLKEVALQLSPIIVDSFIDQQISNRHALVDNVTTILELINEKYVNETSKRFRTEFREDFERMIALMPKLELIELAEALISITAIERKASSDFGTVGGPVDVAFITKHEGFVWIKRKYYFEARLNPRYFYRKYRQNMGDSVS